MASQVDELLAGLGPCDSLAPRPRRTPVAGAHGCLAADPPPRVRGNLDRIASGIRLQRIVGGQAADEPVAAINQNLGVNSDSRNTSRATIDPAPGSAGKWRTDAWNHCRRRSPSSPGRAAGSAG